jgi:hypothetical protein
MSTSSSNSFGTKSQLRIGNDDVEFYSLKALERAGVGNVARLPFSLKVLLENLLRHEDARFVHAEDIRALAGWDPTSAEGATEKEISFMPARVLLQDFTGVPAVVDLAAMRDAMRHLGGDPKKINPLLPAELVIDHSVQVDKFGTASAFSFNADLEMQRNIERYAFLRWGQKGFQNFKVVPPDTGICHQVNLEYLAALDADSTGGRLQTFWEAAGRRDGDGPCAHRDADAAQEGRRRKIRRILRARTFKPDAAGPRDDCEYGARVRRDDGILPRGRRGARVFEIHRAQRRAGEAR